MIHPTQLLRTESERGQRFAAPRAQAIFAEQECGVRMCPGLARCLRLERFYKITVFVALLVALAVLQAACTAYFIGTTKVWRGNYKLQEQVAEWIVYLSPILGGLFALIVAVQGNALHRPSFIGAAAMVQAVAGWLLILPELYHPHYQQLNATAVADQELCRLSSRNVVLGESMADYDEGRRYIAMGVMVLYQLVHGLTSVSLIAHGVSYIDDGCRKYAATTLICLVIVGLQIGRFIGFNLTLIPIAFNRNIFFSFAWLVTMTAIGVFGFLISLFPKLPKRIIVDFGVDRILNRQNDFALDAQPTCWQSIVRVFSSRLLMVNVCAAMAMHVAIVNFQALREEFFRTRFVDFPDEFDYRFSFYNVSQMVFMCLAVTVLALVIARRRPTTQFYVYWIAVAYALITLLFATYAFIKCEDRVDLRYKQVVSGCNARCGCHMDVFAPVCLEGRTYYSACYAGCKTQTDAGYTDCGCSRLISHMATEGSCNSDKCQMVAMIANANTVVTFGLKISAFVIHIIIALRSVDDQRLKSAALGMLLTFTMLLPFFPFKIIYEMIKSSLCQYSANGECITFKESFPTTISILTISLMLISVIITLCMLVFAKKTEMYKRRYSQRPLPPLHPPSTAIQPEVSLEVLNEEAEELPLQLSDGSDDHFLRSDSNEDGEGDGYTDSDIDNELRRVEENAADVRKPVVEETNF